MRVTVAGVFGALSVVASVFLFATQAQAAKLAVMPAQIDESAAAEIPDLIDDYLLTAVQNQSGLEVIGQDDIEAMIGFERKKEMLGCDDISCFADIGGALGVDKIVVFRIARVGEQWVTTSKLINTRQSKVEVRTSDFVDGDVAALLKAVGGVVGKLFGVEPTKPSPFLKAEPDHAAPPPVESIANDPSSAEGDSAPTTFELDITGAPFPIGWGVAASEGADVGDTFIAYKYAMINPRLQWRYKDLRPLSFLAEASLGVAFARFAEIDGYDGPGGTSGTSTVDPSDFSITESDEASMWLHVAHVVRLTPYRNHDRWWGLSSDRLAIDLALGGYLQLGSETEVGGLARLELRIYYLSVGMMVTVGPDTGIDIGFPLSLRFGF